MCASGSSEQLVDVSVGDCVRLQLDFFGVPGGVGTLERPERIVSITKLDRACKNADRDDAITLPD